MLVDTVVILKRKDCVTLKLHFTAVVETETPCMHSAVCTDFPISNIYKCSNATAIYGASSTGVS